MSLDVAKQSTTGTVGAASAALVAANLGRHELIVTNTHASQVLTVELQTVAGVAPTAVAGEGITLQPGGAFVTQFRGAMAVIGSGAGTTYSLVEI